jgi:hypothetical protein
LGRHQAKLRKESHLVEIKVLGLDLAILNLEDRNAMICAPNEAMIAAPAAMSASHTSLDMGGSVGLTPQEQLGELLNF